MNTTADNRLRRLAEQQPNAPFAKDVLRLLKAADSHCVHCFQQGFDEGREFTVEPGIDMTPDQQVEWWERVAYRQTARAERAEEVIAEVRALHAPHDAAPDFSQQCSSCSMPWPCATIALLPEPLGGTDG